MSFGHIGYCIKHLYSMPITMGNSEVIQYGLRSEHRTSQANRPESNGLNLLEYIKTLQQAPSKLIYTDTAQMWAACECDEESWHWLNLETDSLKLVYGMGMAVCVNLVMTYTLKCHFSVHVFDFWETIPGLENNANLRASACAKLIHLELTHTATCFVHHCCLTRLANKKT